MEHVLNENLIITDAEKVEDELVRITGEHPDMGRIYSDLTEGRNKIFYLDNDLKLKQGPDKEVTRAWLDTGKKTSTGGPIMISLVKQDGYYGGYYVGTPCYLVNRMCDKNPRQARTLRANLCKFNDKYKNFNVTTEGKGDEAETSNILHLKENSRKSNCASGKSNVTEEIYQQLLFPDWKSKSGLDRFIKIIGTRIKQLHERKQTEFYVSNKIQSVVVNTGMLNRFGSDILVFYRFNMKYQTYVAECVIHGKQDYLNNDFSREQASTEIEPICFFDKGTELFNPSMDDFDLNQNCLIHIIQERKSRFPESIQNQSDIKIVGQLMKALERGVKMQHRDHTFAKASYSGKSGEVSWYMPLHIDAALNEKPELVMAIRKNGVFYEVKTILPFDEEIEDRITALSLYNRIWN